MLIDDDLCWLKLIDAHQENCFDNVDDGGDDGEVGDNDGENHDDDDNHDNDDDNHYNVGDNDDDNDDKDDDDDGDNDDDDGDDNDDDAQLGPTSPGWRGQAKYNGWQLATLLSSREKKSKAEQKGKRRHFTSPWSCWPSTVALKRRIGQT